MTTKTIKTVLFAGLIAAMILPFSGMNYAVAEELDKEQVEKIAKTAQKLMKMLETEDDPKKIEIIKKKLDAYLVILNSVGLYTEEQFEVVKKERQDDRPEEVSAQAFCPSCNDPTLNIKVGFDYRLWGFHGTANGGWDKVTNADKNGFSQATVGSWGADYAHTWYQFYLSNGANSATASFTPYITNSNDGLKHNYGTTSDTITSTEIGQTYAANVAYGNIDAKDKVKLVVVLSTIT